MIERIVEFIQKMKETVDENPLLRFGVDVLITVAALVASFTTFTHILGFPGVSIVDRVLELVYFCVSCRIAWAVFCWLYNKHKS